MGGFGAKEAAKAHLEKLGYEVIDVGTLSEDNPVAYYDVAYLDAQPAIYESDNLRVVRLNAPLTIGINGKKGLGVVAKP